MSFALQLNNTGNFAFRVAVDTSTVQQLIFFWEITDFLCVQHNSKYSHWMCDRIMGLIMLYHVVNILTIWLYCVLTRGHFPPQFFRTDAIFWWNVSIWNVLYLEERLRGVTLCAGLSRSSKDALCVSVMSPHKICSASSSICSCVTDEALTNYFSSPRPHKSYLTFWHLMSTIVDVPHR